MKDRKVIQVRNKAAHLVSPSCRKSHLKEAQFILQVAIIALSKKAMLAAGNAFISAEALQIHEAAWRCPIRRAGEHLFSLVRD